LPNTPSFPFRIECRVDPLRPPDKADMPTTQRGFFKKVVGLIRSSAAIATMTLAPEAPVRGVSALARAKRRGHVACPQASLSTRPSAHRRERDELATLPAFRQERGMGRRAPTRRPQSLKRHLPYCPRRAHQRLREPVSSCRVLLTAMLARALSCSPQLSSEHSRESHAIPQETRPVTLHTYG
jgi:hypothetical protein